MSKCNCGNIDPVYINLAKLFNTDDSDKIKAEINSKKKLNETFLFIEIQDQDSQPVRIERLA
jgi:hypothetical protein